MNQSILGLKIVRIKEGYQDLLEINGDSAWTKKVWDIRRDLPVGTNTEEGKAALLLTGIENGSIITIASCIEGRANDCITAWLFIPTNVEIDGKQIVDLVESIKKELFANERNDEKLTKLFSYSYPVSKALSTTIVSSGDKFAFRKYGRGTGYELYELFNNLEQAEYRQYKGVFLIDNIANITYDGTDLTNYPIKGLVTINAVPMTHGFQASINNHLLTQPISLPDGDEVTVIWKRQGYKTIEKNWVVNSKDNIPTINDADIYVLVPTNIFVVRDKQSKKPLNNCSINVDALKYGSTFIIPESNVKKCHVTVTADGYCDYSKTCDMTEDRITIYLEREKYNYDFKIELQYEEKRYADLHVETDEKLKGRSPIAGYIRDNRYENLLMYKPLRAKHILFTSLVFLLVFLLGIWAGLYFSDYFNASQNEVPDTRNTNYQAVGAQVQSNEEGSDNKNKKEEDDDDFKAATKYLDENTIWKRDEMQKFHSLDGLWDAINMHKFDVVLSYKNKLKESNQFSNLIVAIEQTNKEFTSNYCEDGDFDITVLKYINSLNSSSTNRNHDVSKERSGGRINRSGSNQQNDDAQNNF